VKGQLHEPAGLVDRRKFFCAHLLGSEIGEVEVIPASLLVEDPHEPGRLSWTGI
jgi:hypothetical protein